MCDVSTVTNYTPYITAIGGAAVGGVISFIVGARLAQKNHANAIKLTKRQEFNKAATEFQCAFTSILAAIPDMEIGNGNTIMDALRSNYAEHRNALLRFKVILSESDRAEIEKAWDNYCYDEAISEDDKPTYDERFNKYSTEYSLSKTDKENFGTKKQLALDNISRLFSFAKIR